MAKTNVTKYNPMEMLNKAFNFADWATATVELEDTDYAETVTTGAREIHIIQIAGSDPVTIKFKNEAGIYPNDGTDDYEFTLASPNLPFVADKMQMDAVSIKGTASNDYVILWYK